MICPFCEEGRVYRVRLTALDQVAFLCEECDALWFGQAEIARDSYVVFEAYMRSRGRPGLWSEVDVLERDLASG